LQRKKSPPNVLVAFEQRGLAEALPERCSIHFIFRGGAGKKKLFYTQVKKVFVRVWRGECGPGRGEPGRVPSRGRPASTSHN